MYRRKLSTRRCGFTLVEALVALTIMTMIGAVVLVSIETSVVNTKSNVDSSIAEGMAQQLVDEVLGKRYHAIGSDPYDYPLTGSNWELEGNGRERFNDTDDFNGFVANGAENIWGNPLGEGDGAGGFRHANLRVESGYFDTWRQEIEVYYVDENDLSLRLDPYETSNYRAVEVTISRQQSDGAYMPLANLRRVYAYVPVP